MKLKFHTDDSNFSLLVVIIGTIYFFIAFYYLLVPLITDPLLFCGLFFLWILFGVYWGLNPRNYSSKLRGYVGICGLIIICAIILTRFYSPYNQILFSTLGFLVGLAITAAYELITRGIDRIRHKPIQPTKPSPPRDIQYAFILMGIVLALFESWMILGTSLNMYWNWAGLILGLLVLGYLFWLIFKYRKTPWSPT